MTGQKTRALQVPPVVLYKALGMGQQEVLAVHTFSVLSCLIFCDPVADLIPILDNFHEQKVILYLLNIDLDC